MKRTIIDIYRFVKNTLHLFVLFACANEPSECAHTFERVNERNLVNIVVIIIMITLKISECRHFNPEENNDVRC